MSIRLSKNHGVNTMIPRCFWCGNHMAGDYIPCDKCSADMEKGITLIEADMCPAFNGQKPIQDGLYPTGSYFVLREDAVRLVVNNDKISDELLKKRKAFMQPEDFKKFAIQHFVKCIL